MWSCHKKEYLSKTPPTHNKLHLNQNNFIKTFCFLEKVNRKQKKKWPVRSFLWLTCDGDSKPKTPFWKIHPGRLMAGTYKSPMKRKEHDLNQTSRELCSMLIFRGVSLLPRCLDHSFWNSYWDAHGRIPQVYTKVCGVYWGEVTHWS